MGDVSAWFGGVRMMSMHASICGGFVCNDKYYVCDGLLTVGIQRSCPYSFADKGFVELV